MARVFSTFSKKMKLFSKLFGDSSNIVDPEKIKISSMKSLRSLGVEVADYLPTLEAESELSPKNSTDVARRCAVLNQIIGIGFGADLGGLRDSMIRYNIMDYTSDHERDMLTRASVTSQEKIDAEWVVECTQSFAWCLGLADLNPLNHCDDDLASCYPSPHEDPSSFIASAKLKSFSEIYGQADLHYRLHWAARNARLNQDDFPVSESIIRERRRALDWVIGVEDNWDEIPSDT